MASSIDGSGHLEFGPDDRMVRRLTDLGIEWDIQTVDMSLIDLDDNTYQTRIDAGSADEEFVLRYKDAYHNGERLPMTLVVVPYAMRNVKAAQHSPCCGRHRLEAARRAGVKSITTLRAHPRHQGDVDALKDLSLFDNAANGKSISSDETYNYCASEVIQKHGGLPAGMPDAKFVSKMFRRWAGRGITRERLVLYVKSLLAKQRCESLGLSTPAGHVDHFAKLWSWHSDTAFDSLARAFCPAVGDADVRNALSEGKKKRKSAVDTLSDIANARRGYGKATTERQDAATILSWRCKDIRKILSRLDTDMSLGFEMLESIETQVEEIYAETHETVSRLRAKIGGLNA